MSNQLKTATCIDCGKEYEMAYKTYFNIKSKNPSNPQFRCPECMSKHRSQMNKTRAENMSKEQKEEMYKKAASKLSATLSKLSQEEMAERMRKANEGREHWLKNQTEEERQRISQIHADSNRRRWESKSEEEKQHERDAAKERWNNKSEEEKKEHSQKTADTWNNRSKEERDLISKKIQVSAYKRWDPEEESEMNKPEDYDWQARLVRQIKESYIATCYELIDASNFDKDKELNDMSKRMDEFEYDVKVADIILASRNKYPHYFMSVSILDLGNEDEDEAIEDERHCSFDKKQWIYSIILNQNKFEKAFIEFMYAVFDMDFVVEFYMRQARGTLFPYPTYTTKQLIDFFKLMKEYATDNSTSITREDKLIKNFHPSIYRTRAAEDKKSAVEAWSDEELMRKCMLNRLMYKHHLSPEIVRDGFNIAKIAPKPSIFTTAQAIDLLLEYTKPGDVIYDGNCGFSGKLLAAIVLGNRKYVTTLDESSPQYQETIFIPKWFAANMMKEVSTSNIVLETEMSPKKFAEYNDKNTVFIQEINPSMYADPKGKHSTNTDEIITKRLKEFDKCKKFVFVCKDTDKYKDYVVDVDIKRTHLYMYTTKIIVIERS